MTKYPLIIGTVQALTSPEAPEIKEDDRQELVKTLTLTGGVFTPSAEVVDMGYCEDGEVVVLTGVKYTSTDWETIKGYWTGRTLVSVTGTPGISGNNRRIVVKSHTEDKRWAIVTVNLEIWRM